jgi:hypothetical protein
VDDAYRPTMDVDFNRCIVVAMFRGERVQIRQITVDSVSETSNSVIIRFSELGYGIKLDQGKKPPKPERPYAFIVVPKTNKEIILEEKAQDKYAVAHGQPPQWKQWARLSPVQSTQLKE